MTVRELQGSGTLTIGRDARKAVRKFHVTPWSSARDFVDALLGRVDPDSGLRSPPSAFSSRQDLWASEAVVEGLGKSSTDEEGNIHYDGGARVTVQYRGLPFSPRRSTRSRPDDPASAAYLSEEVSIGGETAPVRMKNADGEPLWEWGDGEAIRGEDDLRLFQVRPRAEWTITRHEVAELPRDAIFQAVGKVNGDEVAGLAAETLLFLGAHARREVSTDEAAPWRVRYQFEFHPAGHNKAYRGEGDGYDDVRTISGGAKLYSTFDMRSLVPELGV